MRRTRCWVGDHAGAGDGHAASAVLAQSSAGASGDVVKLGFVTKFPVDFFFTLENAAKAWDEAHPEAEVLFAQGQSATDDAGRHRGHRGPRRAGCRRDRRHPHERRGHPGARRRHRGGRQDRADGQRPADAGPASRPSSRRTTSRAACSRASGWPACSRPATRWPSCEGVPGVAALDARVDGMLQGLGDLARRDRGRQASCRRAAPRTRARRRPRTS